MIVQFSLIPGLLLSLTFGAFLFLAGCSGSEKESSKSNSKDTTKTIVEKSEEKKSPVVYSDTLPGKEGYMFFLQNITEEEYEDLKVVSSSRIQDIKVKCPENEDCSRMIEKIRIKDSKADPLVSRDGENLKLKILLKENEYVTFQDNPSESDDFANYHFLDYMKDINYYVVKALFYEASDVFLVNANTGEKISIEGEPVVAPDKSKIISSSLDLYAGFIFNGIKIFEMNDNALVEILTFSPENWGPVEPEWIDNNTLRMKQEVHNIEHPDKPVYKYCKLIIERI